MYPLFYLLFRDKTGYYLEFKEKLPTLSDQQINEYYELLSSTFIHRETDLNKACIEFIDQNVVGKNILDVACGKGYLSERMAGQGFNVTGVDIIVPPTASENPAYLQAEITDLPFPDNHFDTVVCTHTLEHIRNMDKAISEIERVCKTRLLIVVPCQREYRYSFDLHIHFFPYAYKLREVTGPRGAIQKLGGDFAYMRDLP
jgi:ubiquinone/menaquinone biosynthesis C-methylase UbiE